MVFQRAAELERQGMLDNAAALCETVLAVQPDDFEALFRLGVLRYRQRRTGEALKHFAAAVKSNRPMRSPGRTWQTFA